MKNKVEATVGKLVSEIERKISMIKLIKFEAFYNFYINNLLKRSNFRYCRIDLFSDFKHQQ